MRRRKAWSGIKHKELGMREEGGRRRNDHSIMDEEGRKERMNGRSTGKYELQRRK